eukprot:CAMPEP_0115023134 /NCGR_PEP_ID=MMETSP0216-20121206/32147_1 /TAXON_ID=223996 /ORGANISM="Protocruzia adherens, Strain Boccale" /LENGTH=807 /DNA_ID=CAMNT_0002396315 /DNA_START=140 /DNA_END=2566 /DNA_ORIENTATION=-
MAGSIQIQHNEVILLMLDYLKQRHLFKSLLTLEEESKTTLHVYGKEVEFFRQLILDGLWTEADNFLKPLGSRSNFEISNVLFEIGKQEFLEKLETQNAETDVDDLVQKLKSLEDKCSKETFNNLCYCLTLQKLSDHPDYASWTVERGRLECFEKSKEYLKAIYPESCKENQPFEANRLLTLLKRAARISYDTGDFSSINPDPNESISLLFDSPDVEQNLDQFERFEKRNTSHSFKDGYGNIAREPARDRNNELTQSLVMDLPSYQKEKPKKSLEVIKATNNPRNSTDNEKMKFILQQKGQDNYHSDDPGQHLHTDIINNYEGGVIEEVAGEDGNFKKTVTFNVKKERVSEVITSDSGEFSREVIDDEGNVRERSAMDNVQERSDMEDIDDPESAEERFSTARQIDPSQFQMNQVEVDQDRQAASAFLKHETEKSKEPEKVLLMDNFDQSMEGEQSQGGKESSFSPQQSDPFREFDPQNLNEVGILNDMQPIRTSCFSPDGEFFVIGTNSKSVKICPLRDIMEKPYHPGDGPHQIPVCFEQKNHHAGSIYCISWSGSGKLIATGSNDKHIKVLALPDLSADPTQRGQTITLRGHHATVRAVAFNPVTDNELLSGGAFDNCVKLWDTETGKCVANFDGHNGDIYSIQTVADGNTFASVGTDKHIKVWDNRMQTEIMSIDGSMFQDMNSVTLSTSGGVGSPQNLSSAAVGHADGTITLWDLGRRSLIQDYTYHSKDCRGVEFSSDGNWLCSASFDNTVAVLNLKTNKPEMIRNHTDRVVSVKWHPLYPILLSTSADKTARLFIPSDRNLF